MANDWLRASCTYREVFIKGFTESYPEEAADVEVKCHRAWLFHLGNKWLGGASYEVVAKIETIADQSELKKLVKKLANERLNILTWDDLLATR